MAQIMVLLISSSLLGHKDCSVESYEGRDSETVSCIHKMTHWITKTKDESRVFSVYKICQKNISDTTHHHDKLLQNSARTEEYCNSFHLTHQITSDNWFNENMFKTCYQENQIHYSKSRIETYQEVVCSCLPEQVTGREVEIGIVQ